MAEDLQREISMRHFVLARPREPSGKVSSMRGYGRSCTTDELPSGRQLPRHLTG
jgi:hypothetical protein